MSDQKPPNETEVVQADVQIKFPLPNGKHVFGKPVPFPEARKILAQIHAFDQTGDYMQTVQPGIDRFADLTGIRDADVLALCPDMTLGELLSAIQRFFFRPRPAPSNGTGTTAPAGT